MNQPTTKTMTVHARAGRRARWRPGAALAGLLLVSGCAGAKVENLSTAMPHSTATPATLHVAVSVSPDLRSEPSTTKVAQALQADLIKRYRREGIQALVYDGQPPLAGVAIVQVKINRADPGDRMARLLVGFGAGRSVLKTDATITISGQDDTAMRFSASAKSSRKPGLILPGAIAVATSDATRLAIGGGVSVLLEPRSSLQHEADTSAKLIVKQTRQLYETSGWRWPTT